MPRKLTREERIRHFERNGIHYKILVSWHYVTTGDKYHYIHVYRGGENLPFRWLRWWTSSDNEFLGWG